ncbi:hypothetical protein [Roseiarcus sp.]
MRPSDWPTWVRAILDGRPHRASGDLALHVLAVMAGIVDGPQG